MNHGRAGNAWQLGWCVFAALSVSAAISTQSFWCIIAASACTGFIVGTTYYTWIKQ